MRITGRKEDKINIAKTDNRRCNSRRGKGKLSIVGIGPGDISLLSPGARNALNKTQVVIGYKTYIKLLGNLVHKKEIISSGMTGEVKRAKFAIKKALEGNRVCLVSGGDPGIYGMAGIVLELLTNDEKDRIKIEVIPGISAASACASLLGAPLVHDFAVISLSDRLTEKRLIEERVRKACQGDFVIVFYNPRSKSRVTPLKDAWQILMKYKPPQTPVGIVRNAYRENESIEITELKNMLRLRMIDMRTTIIVGNSGTYVKGEYMITPRGYNVIKGEDR